METTCKKMSGTIENQWKFHLVEFQAEIWGVEETG
jgi:hypothetical protein